MKVIQLIPVVAFGDAVSNDARAIKSLLKKAGYDTELYAEAIDARLPAGTAKELTAMPELGADDVLVYHASTGTQINYDLPKYGGHKIMIYHNITPPSFFHGYNTEAEKNMEFGYAGIRFLADKVEYCIADSEYNRQNLREMGYKCPIDVCPILIPFADYDQQPNPGTIRKYKSDEWTNLLFVGRISPNKRQEDVIRAFYSYQKDYNPKTRLFLVGNAGGFESYEQRLKQYAEALGIGDRVIFPGHIRFDEILAYYHLADAFVCMSDHEGFCVPLIEAMYFGKPIVAYNCTAIPYTLGKGGVLLDSRDPAEAAAAIDKAIHDEQLKASVAAGQKEILDSLQAEKVGHLFLELMGKAVGSRNGEGVQPAEIPENETPAAASERRAECRGGKKIGFIIPWYGEKIGGGAEAELRGVVHHLADAGVSLEVLTTCVKSFQDDWNRDYHEPGLTEEYGIAVRRFRVRQRDVQAFDRVNLKLMNDIALTPKEEKTFCEEMINSPDLMDYIRDHGDEYGLFFFIPYMFGPVYYGCQLHPEKSILIPCLHDERYAYMECFREAFSKVKGMIFNAEPERLLAERLYGVKGDSFVTFGLGMDATWKGDGERFRRKFGINSPFILYAGRKDAGKRVDVLIRNFITYKRRNDNDMKLILIGGGDIDIPYNESIIDLGFVDIQDKYDAYAAAEMFCNPSQMESFSIVIMESWLAGRPVLVNGQCAVTKDFVQQANGGLYYESYGEFEECIRYLLSHPEIGNQMGKNGGEYVRSHFVWDVIVNKYLEYIERFSS